MISTLMAASWSHDNHCSASLFSNILSRKKEKVRVRGRVKEHLSKLSQPNLKSVPLSGLCAYVFHWPSLSAMETGERSSLSGHIAIPIINIGFLLLRTEGRMDIAQAVNILRHA